LLPSLLPFASLFHAVINVLRWGEHRGGMFVAVEGCDPNGKKIERSWHLLAEGNDGPLIPSMAVEALVKRILAGETPAQGSRPATQDLELEDYETIFRNRTIYTGQRERTEDTPQKLLYQRLLGNAWNSLPDPLAKLHSSKKAEGLASVQIGKNVLARLVAKLFAFPEAGQDIPVTVTFQQKDAGELWQRTFAGRSFSSFQSEGHGLSERLLSEQFGPFNFGLALVAGPERLSLVVRRWSIFGIPLPLALAPSTTSFESVAEGRFCFHVEIQHPITGLIVRYQGWLVPDN
jgi:hypothetical protein